MIKNYFRSTIIVLTQTILPIMALFLLAPWFISSSILGQWKQSLGSIQPLFLILHGVFYLGLALLWPKLVMRLQVQNQIAVEKVKTALNIRWYLLAIFLFIDVLMIGSML